MKKEQRPWQLLFSMLIIIGLIMVGFSFAADLTGIGGELGFGMKQGYLLLSGLIILGTGIVLRSQIIRSNLRNFLLPANYLTKPKPVTTRKDMFVYVLLLAAWFGLVTGLGEVVIQLFQKLSGKWLFLSLDTIWMAPITDAFLYCLVGFVVFLLAYRVSAQKFIKIPVTFFLIFGALSWTYLIPNIHRYAVWLLAIGVGIQLSRMLLKKPEALYWFIRRNLLGPVVIVIILFLSLYGWRYITEKRAMALIPKTQQGQPNILLIVIDTVRSQNLGLLGYELDNTPFLESLAEESIVFRNAITPNSWTYPSHAAMFTGMYPSQVQTKWQAVFNPSDPVLAEYLSSQGYTTAGFSANTIMVSWEYGLDKGFAHFSDYPVTFGQFVLSSSLMRHLLCYLGHGETCWFYDWFQLTPPIGSKKAARVNEEVTDYLSNQKQGPFFIYLNYFDAHEPHIPVRPYDKQYEFQRINIPGITVSKDPDLRKYEDMENKLKGYDGGIAYIDAQLKTLFTELESLGFLDNAMVIITSDHGQEFMEHGEFGHGGNLYTTTLRVPLLILNTTANSEGKGVWVDDLVTLQDLPATIMDYIGLGGKSPFPGASLLDYRFSNSTREKSHQNYVISETADSVEWDKSNIQASIMQDNFHYISWWGEWEELYSLDDFWETHNLIKDPVYKEVVAKFRDLLENHQQLSTK